MVRVRLLLAVLALVGAGACRADTIRTTKDDASTTVAPPSPTSGAVGSTTAKRRGPSSTTKDAGGPSTTEAGSGSGSSGGGVVLGGSSLGPTSLGTPADDAVAAMRKALGTPTRDLKDPGAQCPGPDRFVRWGRFSLYFSAGKLAGWGYESTPSGPPQLSTPSGITIGSTVSTLRRVYGDKLEVHAADPPFPAGFRVPVSGAHLTGTLTGTADAASTTSLAYGITCGE